MSVMRGEILEQPGVVSRLAADPAAFRAAAGKARAAGARFVIYAARGTSDNAAVYGKYLATIAAGLPAGLAVPSAVTVYEAGIDFRDCLVVGISQSGATPDVAEYVAHARAAGAYTIAVTNDEDSLLADEADAVLATRAGREQAVAATKTYTSQLAALALFWAAWTGDDGVAAELAAGVPAAMTAAIEAMEPAIEDVAMRLSHTDRLLVAGRGYNYATALETALKVKETCYLAAMPFSAADLMHGPIAMLEPRYPVLLFAPPGRAEAGMLELAAELKGRGAETYVVAAPGAARGVTSALELPVAVSEPLSPLVAALPGQLLALHLSLARGLDPDRPRGLNKVTETY